MGALVVMAACGSSGGEPDVVRSEDHPARSPVELQQPLAAEDIDARRAGWERSGPEAYRYRIVSTCGCDRNGTFTVTVVDEAVVAVEPQDAPPGERYRRWYGQSVEAMFAMFDEAVLVATQEGADAEAAASFDAASGRPTSFTVRWNAVDAPYAATIEDFEVLDRADVERPVGDTVRIGVTNQSFDHPDAHITITVDGEVAIDSVLPVRGQHHVVPYAVPLSPGRHVLEATSDAGARHTEVIDVAAGEPLHLLVSHWTGEGAAPGQAHFQVHQDGEPIVTG